MILWCFIDFITHGHGADGVSDSSDFWKPIMSDHKKMTESMKPHDHDGKTPEVDVIALADYYASLGVFGETDEAVNLGKQIMTVVAL